MDLFDIFGKVLFTATATTIKDLVIAALKNGANLTEADLTGANLTEANLIGANLTEADLTGANLTEANLIGANLTEADLIRADLTGANLTRANLAWANLTGANLTRANLTRADLTGANLTGADLIGANLTEADLTEADLIRANNIKISDLQNAQLSVCPVDGAFIAWKKCRNNVVVKLLVQKTSKRSSATTRKCRASQVKVLEVIGAEVGISIFDGKTEYRKGTIVTCDTWNENRWVECGGGIHFYMNRVEAENHN